MAPHDSTIDIKPRSRVEVLVRQMNCVWHFFLVLAHNPLGPAHDVLPGGAQGLPIPPPVHVV